MALDTKEQPQNFELPWQYIVLLVVMVALLPVAVRAIGSIERAERPIPVPEPVSLADFAFEDMAGVSLNTFYDDPTGISVAHPEGWYVSPDQPGSFSLSNYPPVTTQEEYDALPPDSVIIMFENIPVAGSALPDGRVLDESVSASELLALYIGMPSDDPAIADIEETTMGPIPAARYRIVDNSLIYDVVVAHPAGETFVTAIALVVDENAPYFEDLWADILANVTIHSAAQ